MYAGLCIATKHCQEQLLNTGSSPQTQLSVTLQISCQKNRTTIIINMSTVLFLLKLLFFNSMETTPSGAQRPR